MAVSSSSARSPMHYLFSLLLLIGGSALLFFESHGKSRIFAIAFWLLAVSPLVTIYLVHPREDRISKKLFFALLLPLTASPFFIAAVGKSGDSWQVVLGFWILSAAVGILVLGIAGLFSSFLPRAHAGFLLASLLYVGAICGIWISPIFSSPKLDRFWLAINPLAALSTLFPSLDWLRHGLLYQTNPLPTGGPFRYPNWGSFAVGAFLVGITCMVLGEFVRRKQRLKKKE